MPDSSKKDYYQKNREARIAYQKQYYKDNKEAIKRRKELRLADDPEWGEERRAYNKSYYKKNREHIKRTRLKRAAVIWAQVEKEEKKLRDTTK